MFANIESTMKVNHKPCCFAYCYWLVNKEVLIITWDMSHELSHTNVFLLDG